MMMRKAPSLVDLCVMLAIDNVRYLGDVGDLDCHLLDRILSHCSVDQLMHIEDSTEGRDLSSVTDKYWMEFFKRRFGVDSLNITIERMRRKNVTFPWRKLYEAKVKESDEATQRSLDRIRERYKEVDAASRSRSGFTLSDDDLSSIGEPCYSEKQKRQIRVCTTLPPSSKKRSYWGGASGATAANIYNTKSSLMKKAKLDFVNCREVKNLAAMKKTLVHRTHSVPPSKGKPVATGLASSSSKLMKPVQRRF